MTKETAIKLDRKVLGVILRRVNESRKSSFTSGGFGPGVKGMLIEISKKINPVGESYTGKFSGPLHGGPNSTPFVLGLSIGVLEKFTNHIRLMLSPTEIVVTTPVYSKIRGCLSEIQNSLGYEYEFRKGYEAGMEGEHWNHSYVTLGKQIKREVYKIESSGGLGNKDIPHEVMSVMDEIIGVYFFKMLILEVTKIFKYAGREGRWTAHKKNIIPKCIALLHEMYHLVNIQIKYLKKTYLK